MDNESLYISLFGYVAFCGLMIVPLWTIFSRAGMPGFFALLFCLPLVGPLLVLYLLAFRSRLTPSGPPGGRGA